MKSMFDRIERLPYALQLAVYATIVIVGAFSFGYGADQLTHDGDWTLLAGVVGGILASAAIVFAAKPRRSVGFDS